MQYKIPVKIDNEDPILLGLSLRQMTIIMVGGAIAYSLFKSLAQKMDPTLAAFPSILIAVLAFIIAVFKHSEMTFVPFILSLLRQNINPKERIWQNTVDSFQPIDIGYLTSMAEKKQDRVDIENKLDKIKELGDKLEKI